MENSLTKFILIVVCCAISRNANIFGSLKNTTCYHDSKNSCLTFGYCFKHYSVDKKKYIHGCLESEDLIEVWAICTINNEKSNILCCNSYDMCNFELELTIYEAPPVNKNKIKFLCFFLIVGVVAGIIIFIFIKKYRIKKRKLEHILGTNTISEFRPLLPSTEARGIEFVTRIGNGKYGDVFCCIWRGQTVAVKVFSSEKKDSWNSELELMQTRFLQHSNILTLLFADSVCDEIGEKFYLITEYHKNGSLFDFLHENVLTKHNMFEMSLCIASGIDFMHAKLVGIDKRPAIAHRDIKSKNILVKNDLTCCIGDFGLAITSEQYDGEKERKNKRSVGTLRYMSPELLIYDPNSYYFDAVITSDIYAAGLVFWEIISRTAINKATDNCPPSILPYYDYIKELPTQEQMTELVCEKKIRPKFPPTHDDFGLESFVNLIEMCWTHVFAARIKAMTVKKMLGRIARCDKMRNPQC